MSEQIKGISATWYHEDGDDKSAVYRLLNMVHAMAGMMAQVNLGGWHLTKTASFTDYVLTTWSNGIVDITAETQKGYDGKHVMSHHYRLDAHKED